MNLHFTKSLKSRLIIFLFCSSFIPILLIGGSLSYKIFLLYENNVKSLLKNELLVASGNIENIMQSMTYMSQQLVYDGEIGKSLYAYFDEDNAISKVNRLDYLNNQISTYELANPNLCNITYLYKGSDGKFTNINSTLIRSHIPDESLLLTRKNIITYYGPHETFSIASDYTVISLVRPVSVVGYEDVYIYIESGYKKMEMFTAETLNSLGAVYTIVSENGTSVYSSEKDIFPINDSEKKQYVSYVADTKNKWCLKALIPKDLYYEYIRNIVFDYFVFGVISICFSILISFIIWKSISNPLKKFERNLRDINSSNIKQDIQKINVSEFDKNFEYFANMKNQVINLVETVEKEERQKSILEVKQLIGKINPHFINNTLDTLKWYADGKQYDDIVEFVSALNRLLVYNMEKVKETTLQSELDAVHSYIQLQTYKYDIEFIEDISIPAQMLNSSLPRFILQPIVENAIMHGLEGKGIIKLLVSLLANGKISIRVINKGYPMSCQKIEQILNSSDDMSSSGIGIQYVIKMLEGRYGGEYEFNINSNDMGENVVEIVVPYEL